MDVFNYFRNLRNRHFIHDENAYTRCTPAAILNKRDFDYKIEKVFCINISAETLTPENRSQLQELTNVAGAWVVKELEALYKTLMEELENESYEDLYKRKTPGIRGPSVDEIGKKRQT
ncbi:MAG: hypothetical protein JKX97_05875 [Candidatus Lindowbacteria bacterium]|nr:hypothetical protein [Candidatus Lindowbacteria bacterium]